MPVQTTYPGVYVEERPSGVHTIVGVSTSVTAFVGATRLGPVGEPVRINSAAEFARVFGGPLDADRPLGHAVSHFFANGGTQAIVVRAVGAGGTAPSVASATMQNGTTDVLILDTASVGEWGNRTGGAGLEATIDYDATSNPDDLFNIVLTLRGLDPRTGASLVLAEEAFTNVSMSPGHPRSYDKVLQGSSLVTVDESSPDPGGTAKGSSAGGSPLSAQTTITPANNTLRISVDQTAPVDVQIAAGNNITRTTIQSNVQDAVDAAGLDVAITLDSNALKLESNNGGPDSAVVVTPAPNDASKDLVLGRAFGGTEVSGSAGSRPDPQVWPFSGGADGGAVEAGDVVPASGSGGVFSLKTLLFPRFNILCLPGLTADDAQELGQALAYCKEERAFLVVDTPAGWVFDPPALGSLPALGEHGAIYYPRIVQVEDRPGGQSADLDLPPSGAIAGVFARIDAQRGVWKAPAGLEVGLVGFTRLAEVTDDARSGLLNPRGVNVLRTFPAGGTVVWGARTLRGDDTLSSEFKYVPVRRLTDYIASSLYLGTTFAVFEPNGPDLWAQLRLAVGTFMRGLFRQGAFQQSAKRAERDSFFVVCDETVNTQAEIDLGRVNVVVGFAPLKPAEFVVITITQISQLEE